MVCSCQPSKRNIRDLHLQCEESYTSWLLLPSLKRQMYANKLRVLLLQKSYFHEFFFSEASTLLMKLSCLVSSMVNPPFSE